MFHTLVAHWQYLWLITASLLAGGINAIAGGGSFLSFPAMLALGVPPVEANATNTVALWPGQLASLATLRDDVRRTLLPVVLSVSVVGGVTGALVLLHTRQRTFLYLLPWLLLGGSLIFWVSAPVSRWLRGRAAHSHASELGERPIAAWKLWLAMLPICFYVGYFGAGGGFLVMTVLALFGMENMHELNALKIVIATASNFFAIVTFVISGRILWHYCLISMVFAAAGGYLGARYAKRMNPEVLRMVVVVIGLVISAYFFWKDYSA